MLGSLPIIRRALHCEARQLFRQRRQLIQVPP